MPHVGGQFQSAHTFMLGGEPLDDAPGVVGRPVVNIEDSAVGRHKVLVDHDAQQVAQSLVGCAQHLLLIVAGHHYEKSVFAHRVRSL